MDADSDSVRELIQRGAKMRVGRTLGRTIYLKDKSGDLCVGVVDTEELAEEIMKRWNAE